MTAYPQTAGFKDVTVVLPVINETYSLVQTVETILNSSKPDVCELLIVVAGRTTPESLAAIDSLKARFGDLVVIHRQTLKYLGGALREAFDLARGSHVILMSTDLETDPALVPKMIENARKNPDAIVTVSRWCRGGSFEGYNPVKLFANAVFQKLLSLLYWTRLSDMTYAFRILPSKLVQAIAWEELRHPFLLETMIKPLRLGVRAIEIPGSWRARTEGKSQNTFLRNFEYFGIAWRVRFTPISKILRS